MDLLHMLSNDVISMNMINGKIFAARFARPIQRNYSVYFLETPLTWSVLDLYMQPRLSRLAGDQKIHYHTCAEGMANDHFVGVVTYPAMSYGLYRPALVKTD